MVTSSYVGPDKSYQFPNIVIWKAIRTLILPNMYQRFKKRYQAKSYATCSPVIQFDSSIRHFYAWDLKYTILYDLPILIHD